MGSKRSPPPDPAQQDLARAQATAMTDQMAQSKEEFAYMRELSKEQLKRGDEQWEYQRGLQDESRDRSNRFEKRYWDTTARQEDEFYKTVDQFDTAAERNRLGGRAITDVESQMEIGRGAMNRGLASRGINPGSAAAIAAYGDMEFGGTLAKAGAATMAQEAARREGMQLRAQAAGLGGNTAGQSASYLGAAGNMGNSALTAGGAGMAARGAAFQGYNQGMQNAQGWGAGANNTFNSVAQQSQARAASGGSPFGAILGTVAGSFFGPMGAQVGGMMGQQLFGGPPKP